MTSHQWRKVDELLDQAMELSPGERAAFLDRECNGDAALRREIESLLAAHDAASGFFDNGPASVAEDLIQNRQAEAMAGRTIGHYQLTREIGRGGMGVVYEAFRADDQFRQKVAIKLLWPGMNSSEIARRFRHERQILANLDHPHIARLLDGGVTEEGLPYFAMEFIEGRPITDYCNAHKLSIAERLKLFQQVCSAVQYAHQNLIIHRDLKPGNILVTPPSEGNAGTAKLLDFGIAKLLDPARHAITAQPTTHALLMTPEYASPEQMRGEAITTASDVYSLGILLYELLTAGHPYRIKDRSLPELVRVVCEQEPEAPSQRVGQFGKLPHGLPETKPERLRAQLRGDLDQITQSAIQKDSNLRYRSVEQLSEDLRRHVEGLPITARKASLAYRTEKFIRRNRVGVVAAALILLTLLGGIVATARQARVAQTERGRAEQQAAEAGRQKAFAETEAAEALRQKSLAETKSKEAEENSARAEQQRQLADEQQRLAEDQKALAVDQAERNRRLLYAAQMNLAAQAWDTNNLKRTNELIDQYWPERGKDDLRGFEWRYLWRLAKPLGKSLTLSSSSTAWSLAYSPDGQKLAVGYNPADLKIWDLQTGRELMTLSGHTRHVRAVAFSPDGQKLATAGGDRMVKIWDTSTGREIFTLAQFEHYANSVAFTPDGRFLMAGSRDNTWRVFEVASGRQLLEVESKATWVNTLALSPDGKTLATGNGGVPSIKLWDVATGKEKAAFNEQGAIWSIAFFPDGKKLVAASKDRTAKIWDLQTGRASVTLSGHTSEIFAIAISPDGRLVATGSADRTIRFWNAANGLEIAMLKSVDNAIFALAFSPDGSKIAVSGKNAEIWEVTTVSRFLALKPTETPPGGEKFYSLAFAPDGSRLMAGGDSLHFWETSSGQEITTYPTLMKGSHPILALAYSRDGKRLAVTDGGPNARVVDSLTGREFFRVTDTCDHITSVSFSPDGKKLLTSGYGDRSFNLRASSKIWDARTGQHLITIPGDSHASAFSPDGRIVAVGVHHIASATPIIRLEDQLVLADSTTGERLLALMDDHEGIMAVAFSPGGKMLAVGYGDGTVKLCESSTGRELARLTGHGAAVKTLAFSPDGSRLATAGQEGVMRLWDITLGIELLALRGHTDEVTSIAFSPDGQILASASLDGTVRFWRAATKEEVAARGRR